jgi:hypothetical protein
VAPQTSAVPRGLAIVVIGAVVVVLAATVATFAVVHSAGTGGDSLIVVPFGLVYGLVGALVVWRQHRNVLGWIFLLMGAGSSLGLLCQVVGLTGVAAGSNAPAYTVWAAWLSVIYVELIGLPVMLASLLFPDGRLPSRRWRPVLYAVVVDIAVGVAIVALSNMDFSDPTLSTTENFPGMRHPLPLLDAHFWEPVYGAYQVVEVLLVVVCALSLVARYRGSGATTRAQIRWVMLAVAVAATGFLVAVAFFSDYIVVAFAVLFPLVPIACGIAILRYRLYDIDRLISRTLSYAVVTGVVLVAYVAVVAALTTVLPDGASSLVVAAATLAAAALVRPVLRGVQRVIDRRFNRSRYDALATVEEFGERLRDQIDPDTTASDLLAVVTRTMAPRTVALGRAASRNGTVAG